MQQPDEVRAIDLDPGELTPEQELERRLYSLAGIPGKETEFEAARIQLQQMREAKG